MDSQTLFHKPSRNLAAVIYHRVFFRHFKVMWFGTALFCVLLCLAACSSSMDDLRTSGNYEACGSFCSNHDSGFQDAFGSDDNLEITSGKSSPQLNIGKVCAISNLFCFPSTLPGYISEEHSSDNSVVEASGVSFDDTFAVGSVQSRNNLSWSQSYAGEVYKLMSGRVVSCSLNFEDSISDISFCQRSSSTQIVTSEKIKTTTLEYLSVPHVEISPPLLDCGQTYLYSPSISFITVANTHNNTSLSVYEPYSTDSQFYPCNRSELTLRPGETAAICFVYLPTFLGMSSSKLVLQTSSGHFLIQARGFAVENPYRIKPLTGLEFSSNGRLTKNLSLFNPFDDIVYVEEVNAWILFSADNTSHSTKITCKSVDNVGGSDRSANPTVPGVKEWSYFGQPTIAMRPHGNFEVGSQRTETLMGIDFPNNCQGRVSGALCMQLHRSSKEILDTVMVPIEAEIAGFVSVFVETLVTSSDENIAIVGLSLRNHGPYLLTVVSISGIGEGVEVFQIKFMEGLMLFANSATQVATVTFTPIETRIHECRLVVLTNDSSNPQIEIPCDDILDATKIVSTSEIKTEADELVLGNWRSHATVTGGASVLDDHEILFPMVEIETHRSKWIAVTNPGQQPVVMQLVLNSGEIVDECRNLLEHSSSSSIVQRRHTTPTKYGFSIGDRSVTEAYVHPNGRALLGPVIFHPSSRCAWKSSALIRNNLTGVEWVPLRGFGGSVSLALFEGIDPLQNIEFSSENSSGSRSCSQPLSREFYAKNVGDLQLEVNRLQVSGTECGLDGFVVENCKGFVLEPGESTKIEISFQNDYSSAVVQRDLELALLTGFLVIPMKASIPTSMLATCRKSVAWIKVKKSSVVILLVGSVVYLVFCYVIPQAVSRDSSTHFSPKMNDFIKSVEENETLITEKVNLIENHDIQSSSPPPANLTVKIGKEKRRRRRKKKGTQLEVSSSQSGNSTPSSPLDSPTKFVATPKKNLQESPTVGQDSQNPFVHTEKNLASKPKSEPKVSMKYVEQKAAVPKAIFPCTNRPSPSTYLTLKSTVAPHARAPGPKLNYVKNEGGGQKDKYRYDIWGEHIFGFRSKEVFAKSPLAIQSNSDSFFARGPQSLVSVSKLKSVSQQDG